ncbi:MAG: [ribosomal protein S5]-alanine N-acetyltransferase [Sphingomonadales bacterium]|nr:[ribosomal protein S5]-alanine N-acetyltransferase [Sphingomonadales bacterium]
MSEIRTARLLLRRARIENLDAIHAVLANPEAMRFWSTPPHADLEQTRAWLRSMIDAPADVSDDYLVVLDGQVIGKAGCWRLPEIGFILHPDFWGRGLAREALEAVVARVFAKFPVEALTADVDPRNAASLGLLKGLGFVETGRAKGTYEVGGALCDSIYLALPRK